MEDIEEILRIAARAIKKAEAMTDEQRAELRSQATNVQVKWEARPRYNKDGWVYFDFDSFVIISNPVISVGRPVFPRWDDNDKPKVF